ncbi:MAG: AI-2E family transporter [Trichodesmium sp. St11_bin5]|nr:AI-2E family transporter [Trichodesmium sp. St11_bin5]
MFISQLKIVTAVVTQTTSKQQKNMNFGKWLGFFSLLIVLYIFWEIRQLLLLIFAAIVLATALNRLVQKFNRWGIERNLAVIATLSLAALIMLVFLLLIVPPFISQFQKLVALIPDVFTEVRSQLIQLYQQRPDLFPAPPTATNMLVQTQKFGTQLFSNFLKIFSNTFTVFLQVLLVFVLTIMFLVNAQAYRRVGLLLFPSFYRRRADEIISKCEVALGNWFGGIVINSVFVATLSGIGLLLLQIDLVLTHALLAGLLNFIPNIGPTLSVVFPIMIAFLDTPWKIAAVGILYIIIQNIESYWLSPVVMAKQVSLLPAITLGAQIFFTTFFGILGLILALPLTVVAKTWIEETLFKDILDPWQQTSSIS